MSNAEVLRPQFRTSAVNQLFKELSDVIRDPRYDRVTFCELLGIIEMLKLHQYERNKDD